MPAAHVAKRKPLATLLLSTTLERNSKQYVSNLACPTYLPIDPTVHQGNFPVNWVGQEILSVAGQNLFLHRRGRGGGGRVLGALLVVPLHGKAVGLVAPVVDSGLVLHILGLPRAARETALHVAEFTVGHLHLMLDEVIGSRNLGWSFVRGLEI